MFKKLFCVFLSLFILTFSLTSCSSTVAGSDVQIIMPIDSDPEYLDPQICSSTAALNIINNCFEGLMDVDENGDIVTACAESYTVSADGLTYTFTLRDDLEWKMTTSAKNLFLDDDAVTINFDTQITAYDFAFALERAVSADTNAPFVSSLFSIKNAEEIYNEEADISSLGVTVLSDLVLQIELEYVDIDFLYTLTTSIAMPCSEEFFEATGGRYGLSTTYLICNGAFYVSGWSENTAITATKNTSYYDYESVMPSSIYFSINDEYSTRPTKVLNGTYEVSPILQNQLDELENNKNAQIYSFQSSTLSLFFNCEDFYLVSPSLRQAIVYSLDMDIIYSELEGTAASGILPSTTYISDESFKYLRTSFSLLEYDADLASTLYREYLEKLDAYTITLSIICSEDHESLVRQLIQSWQSVMGVSFNISVEALDETELNSRIESGDYQIALANINFTGTTAYNALSNFMTDASGNVFNLDSNDFNSLMSEAKTATSVVEMAEKLTAAEQYLISNAVIVPLIEEKIYFGLGADVSGIYFSSTGEIVTFKYALSP